MFFLILLPCFFFKSKLFMDIILFDNILNIYIKKNSWKKIRWCMQDLNSLGVFSVFSDTNNFFFPSPCLDFCRTTEKLYRNDLLYPGNGALCLFRGGPVLYHHHLKDENGVYGVECLVGCLKFKAKKTLDIYKGSF